MCDNPIVSEGRPQKSAVLAHLSYWAQESTGHWSLVQGATNESKIIEVMESDLEAQVVFSNSEEQGLPTNAK